MIHVDHHQTRPTVAEYDPWPRPKLASQLEVGDIYPVSRAAYGDQLVRVEAVLERTPERDPLLHPLTGGAVITDVVVSSPNTLTGEPRYELDVLRAEQFILTYPSDRYGQFLER